MIESKQRRQYKGDVKRRWFSDNYFDLIVWENKAQEILKFELCYGKNKDEHAFVWNKETGTSHLKVDDGEKIPGRLKMSPVFESDAHFDGEVIAAKFLQASKSIDQKVAIFVYNRVKESD